MILSDKQVKSYLQAQGDAYRYLKAVNYPMTKIADRLGIVRQTVYKRFREKSWKAKDWLIVVELINSKK